LPYAGATRLQTCVPFDHNEYEMTMAAMLEVEKVADVLQSYPGSKVFITGHTDATGSADYNLLLSNQRALQIAKYLEMRGVGRSRISLEGKGEHEPVARNYHADGSDAPLGRYLNRQVKLTIESPEPIRADLAGFYVPAALRQKDGEPEEGSSDYWFTVQVLACQSAMSLSRIEGLKEVQEFEGRDGYFRYASGEFRTFEEARTALDLIKESGYPDAFIQTLDWYSKRSR